MKTHLQAHPNRRQLLGAGLATATAGAAGLMGGTSALAAAADGSEDFTFEVTRTEAEWRAMLSADEFNILRRGDTEMPDTSPLVKQYDPGVFFCGGCDLALYDSEWRVHLPGWVFFRHSRPYAVLTEIDTPPAEYGLPEGGPKNMIEVVCRRCGSHHGHIIETQYGPTHCIDGTGLVFRPESA